MPISRHLPSDLIPPNVTVRIQRLHHFHKVGVWIEGSPARVDTRLGGMRLKFMDAARTWIVKVDVDRVPQRTQHHVLPPHAANEVAVWVALAPEDRQFFEPPVRYGRRWICQRFRRDLHFASAAESLDAVVPPHIEDIAARYGANYDMHRNQYGLTSEGTPVFVDYGISYPPALRRAA